MYQMKVTFDEMNTHRTRLFIKCYAIQFPCTFSCSIQLQMAVCHFTNDLILVVGLSQWETDS